MSSIGEPIPPLVPPPDYPVSGELSMTDHHLRNSITITTSTTRRHYVNFRRNFAEILNSFSSYTKAYMVAALCINTLVYISIIIVLSIHGRQPCEQPLEIYLLIYLIRGVVSESLLLTIHLLPIYWRYQHQIPPNVEPPGSIAIMEKVKLMLDFFFIIWFIIGNWWFYSAQMCAFSNPAVYYLTFAILIFGYALLAVPLILFVGLFCCLPFLMIGLRRLTDEEVGKPNGVGATNDELAALPSAIYGDSSKPIVTSLEAIPQEEVWKHCVICLNDYNLGDALRLLPCFHHFHKTCVDDWLRMNKKCPLCIQTIDTSINHRQPHEEEQQEQQRTTSSMERESPPSADVIP
jgi:hypothetical protein